MKLGLLLSIFLPFALALNLDLLEDFFKHSVKIKHVIVFSCSNVKYLKELAILLSSSNFYFNFHLNYKFDHLAETTGKCVFLIDLSCIDSDYVFHETSKSNYFNSSYHWIILNELNKSSEVLFKNISNIGINSKINLLSKTEESTYEISEVYFRGSSLITHKFGCWNYEKGLKLFNPVTYMYNRKNRGDLNELQLRGGLDGTFNYTSEHKYHTVVTRFLMQAFNFKYVT